MVPVYTVSGFGPIPVLSFLSQGDFPARSGLKLDYSLVFRVVGEVAGSLRFDRHMKTILLFVLGVSAIASTSGAQSLVEASKAAQAAHATGMGWPISVNSVPPQGAVAATLKATPSAVGDEPTPITTADTKDPKKEAYWRARLDPRIAQLTTDLAAAEPLRARYAELRAHFYSMRTVFQQQLVAPEMFRIETELRKVQALVDSDTRAIDDLKEEGRVAGALPGWFR